MLNENSIKKQYFKKLSLKFETINEELAHYFRYKSLEIIGFNDNKIFDINEICLKCGFKYVNKKEIITNHSINENNIIFFEIKCPTCKETTKLLKSSSYNKFINSYNNTNKNENIGTKKISKKKGNNLNSFNNFNLSIFKKSF